MTRQTQSDIQEYKNHTMAFGKDWEIRLEDNCLGRKRGYATVKMCCVYIFDNNRYKFIRYAKKTIIHWFPVKTGKSGSKTVYGGNNRFKQVTALSSYKTARFHGIYRQPVYDCYINIYSINLNVPDFKCGLYFTMT